MGFGGADIFKASFKNGELVNVKNIGKPFNTSKDDFGFVMHADQEHGYFSSNRSGTHGYDHIYGFEKIKIIYSIRLSTRSRDRNFGRRTTQRSLDHGRGHESHPRLLRRQGRHHPPLGCIRQAEELSITVVPTAANFGAQSREVCPPAENKAKSGTRFTASSSPMTV